MFACGVAVVVGLKAALRPTASAVRRLVVYASCGTSNGRIASPPSPGERNLMHAVVTTVTINDPDAAQATLENEVVPRVSQAPGFVAGYWVRLSEDKGASVVVFDSEDAARTAAERIQAPAPVTFDSVEVGEVVANA
jgi:hypothetical protein